MSASFLSARRPTVILLAGVALALLLSGTALLPATAATPAPTATTTAPRPTRTPRPTPSPTPTRISAGIKVDARAGSIAISPRVLGSNLPAGQGNAFAHTFAPYSITLLRFNVKP